MAVWNYKTGYHASKPPLSLNDLRGKVQWMEENFYRPALAGQDYAWDGQWKIPIRITDPHTGLVRQYYSWLVRLTQEKNLPEDERAYWVEKKHQAIRLLYFSDTVAPAFEKSFGPEIARGYAKLGLKAPDYAHLPRAAALREIASFQAKLQKTPDAPSDSQQVGVLLERGLGELDPADCARRLGLIEAQLTSGTGQELGASRSIALWPRFFCFLSLATFRLGRYNLFLPLAKAPSSIG